MSPPASAERGSEGHLGSEFRQAFREWRDLRAYVGDRARFPAYGAGRALQQLVAADITAQLPGAGRGEWLLFGSLSLPCRVPVGWRWGAGAPATPGIDPAYVMPRSALDLDMCAVGIADSGPSDRDGQARYYGRRVVGALHSVAGPGMRGLGGLVRYEPDLQILPNGQVVGVIQAVPVDGSGRQVDDPVTVDMDVQPAANVARRGEPQRAIRPFLGVEVPGFAAPLLPLQPSEDVFAAKACLLTGSPLSRRAVPSGPWHRYKDVFDLYFMTRAVPLRAGDLQDAVDGNWNFDRMERDGLPQPYRLYGDATRPGDRYAAGEPEVPWEAGCDRIRAQHPQLAGYPAFSQMSSELGTCLDTLTAAAPDATWSSGRWDGGTAALPAGQGLPASASDAGTRTLNAVQLATTVRGEGATGVACSVCGRPLRSASSIAAGVGPICGGRG